MRVLLAAALAIFLLWLPLPSASVTPPAQLMVRLAAGACLTLAVLARNPGFSKRRHRTVLIGLGGLATLGLLQSLRWPQAIAEIVSSGHVDLAIRASAPGSTSGVYLSLAPEVSRSVGISIVAIAGLFLAGVVAGRHALHRRWLAIAVLASACGQVILGLRPLLAGDVPRLRASFVNPDHLAAYLEISLGVGLAVIWGIAGTMRSRARLEHRVLAIGGAVVFWVFLFVGLLLTGSRAGLLSAFVGLSVGAVLLAAAWRKPGRAAVAASGGLGLAIVILLLRGSSGLERLLGTSWHEVMMRDRPRVWRESLPLLLEFPWVGTGLGSFEQAFPLVQSQVPTRVLWGRAHNDFLELALTGGLLGLALGVICAVGVLRPLVLVLRRGLRTEDRLAAVAALSAIAAVGTHELFDFGLSLPANSATLAILVGAATASRLEQRVPGASERPGFGSRREVSRSEG